MPEARIYLNKKDDKAIARAFSKIDEADIIKIWAKVEDFPETLDT